MIFHLLEWAHFKNAVRTSVGEDYKTLEHSGIATRNVKGHITSENKLTVSWKLQDREQVSAIKMLLGKLTYRNSVWAGILGPLFQN